ncbi:coniferyl alcohol acyltransferase-like [Curcuma longa]|uniref:coniferyl alcohol acyltransferase-like n=1 Tax=Curcuma longa TaxID=136217 RepID=UPI003D9F52A1
MGVRRSYTVTIRAAETITPAETLPEHRLPMSNLDLLLPPMDVGVFFCYEKPMRSLEAMVAVLSVSLAQALSAYYPFAGEVVANSLGEPEVLCNGRGVDFAAAYADVELRELALGDPDDSVEGKLMPKKKAGVFCVQATGLRCGGLVLACKFDHRVADAYSANMFLVFWSELATFGRATRLPFFSRTLLSPRLPLRLHPSIDRLFVPVSSLPPPPISPPPLTDLLVNRIYYIASADVASLQSSTRGRTKVEAFTAYLWRALAKAAEAEGERWCSMGAVVDGRTRLSAAMGNYFGNVLSIPFGRMEVAELRGMGMAEVAERVRGWLKPAATEDHFRVLVDWVEAHRPETAVARIYSGGAEGGLACVVSSGRAFPVKEVEFGWGKPAFGSYHFPWGGTTAYVMPMPSARGNGDWVVYAHLRKSVVAVLEAEQPPVFRPLTPDYYLTDIN